MNGKYIYGCMLLATALLTVGSMMAVWSAMQIIGYVVIGTTVATATLRYGVAPVIAASRAREFAFAVKEELQQPQRIRGASRSAARRLPAPRQDEYIEEEPITFDDEVTTYQTEEIEETRTLDELIREIKHYRMLHYNEGSIIRAVWNVTPDDGRRWDVAVQDYMQIKRELARRS